MIFESQKCGTCIYFQDGECVVAPLMPEVTEESEACEMWDDGRFAKRWDVK
jgi:hypothetical protein